MKKENQNFFNVRTKSVRANVMNINKRKVEENCTISSNHRNARRNLNKMFSGTAIMLSVKSLLKCNDCNKPILSFETLFLTYAYVFWNNFLLQSNCIFKRPFLFICIYLLFKSFSINTKTVIIIANAIRIKGINDDDDGMYSYTFSMYSWNYATISVSPAVCCIFYGSFLQ